MDATDDVAERHAAFVERNSRYPIAEAAPAAILTQFDAACHRHARSLRPRLILEPIDANDCH
jgi:hypothetical protein